MRREPRPLLAIGVIAAHGALVAIAALAASPRPPERPRATLATFDIAPAAAAAPRAAQPVPAPAAARAVKSEIVEAARVVPVAAEPLAAVADVGQACDVAEAIRTRASADPESARSLRAVPRHERSVANAIMLWDGAWTRDGRLEPLRARIEAVVAAEPQRCRDEAQAGPQLIAFGPAGDATMLVIGSGAWRWQDVAPTPLPQIAAADFRTGAAASTPQRDAGDE